MERETPYSTVPRSSNAVGPTSLTFLRGERLTLRPLQESDFNEEYWTWLNDPEVNRFSQRRPFPVSWDSMKSYQEYYDKHPRDGFVLAIVESHTGRHVGNISLVNIQWVHRCGEIAILLGNKDVWGKGYAGEAIQLVTEHAFQELNLHKIFAGTFNPSFIRCVEKLGWTCEGEFKDRIWSQGQYHTQTWLSTFRDEEEK